MNLWFDLKYAWRLATKSWGQSLLCAGVVALSVGLATYVYAIVYGAWLKPLEIPGSQNWYVVHLANNATAEPSVHSLDAYTYQELVKNNRTVKHLGAVSIRPGVLSEGKVSVNLRAYAISPSLLTATQVAPRIGRVFADAENQPEGAAVVILSFATWQNYFASDPVIVGKQARINGKPMQVIGVMPRGFSLGMEADLWLPLQKINLVPADIATPVEAFIALQKSQTRDAVLQEMKVGVDQISQAFPERYNPGRHIFLAHAHRALTDFDKATPILFCVVAVAVALLGTMNISMMFFARLMERRRELALRNALGATRWLLLRQSFLESSAAVLLGLLLSVALAAAAGAWTQNVFDSAAESDRYVNTAEFAIRGHHVLVAVVAALIIWLVSTLFPAWRIGQQDAAVVLAGSGKGTSAGSLRGGHAKTASFLVGVQVMISCLVLVLCSNVVLSQYDAANKRTGLDTALLIVSRTPTTFTAAYLQPEERLLYFDNLTASVNTKISGAAIGFATAVPTRESFTVRMATEANDAVAARELPFLPLISISDNYFQLLGVSLRRGRLFDSSDSNSSINVAILDENLAGQYWPNQDSLGKRIHINPVDNGPWLTVVGVVSHVGGYGSNSFKGRIYRPLRQSAPAAFVAIAKFSPTVQSGHADSQAALKAAAFAVDPDLPLNSIGTLDQVIEADSPRNMANIFIVIAIITGFLAATGLFALISRSVALRTQEVGVRRALGASKWQVTALFLRQGAMLLGLGMVSGGGLGIIATTGLSSSGQFPGILDHVVLVTTSVFLSLAAVIFFASYFPTRHAVALEPGDALRYE